MINAALLLGQVPNLLITVVAGIIAVVVIRGPGRWLAMAGIVVGMIPPFLASALPMVDARAIGTMGVLLSLVSLVSYALLAASVVVGRYWSDGRAAPSAVDPWVGPGEPSTQVPSPPAGPDRAR